MQDWDNRNSGNRMRRSNTKYLTMLMMKWKCCRGRRRCSRNKRIFLQPLRPRERNCNQHRQIEQLKQGERCVLTMQGRARMSPRPRIKSNWAIWQERNKSLIWEHNEDNRTKMIAKPWGIKEQTQEKYKCTACLAWIRLFQIQTEKSWQNKQKPAMIAHLALTQSYFTQNMYARIINKDFMIFLKIFKAK